MFGSLQSGQGLQGEGEEGTPLGARRTTTRRSDQEPDTEVLLQGSHSFGRALLTDPQIIRRGLELPGLRHGNERTQRLDIRTLTLGSQPEVVSD